MRTDRIASLKRKLVKLPVPVINHTMWAWGTKAVEQRQQRLRGWEPNDLVDSPINKLGRVDKNAIGQTGTSWLRGK